jgi:hypothetical protein
VGASDVGAAVVVSQSSHGTGISDCVAGAVVVGWGWQSWQGLQSMQGSQSLQSAAQHPLKYSNIPFAKDLHSRSSHFVPVALVYTQVGFSIQSLSVHFLQVAISCLNHLSSH